MKKAYALIFISLFCGCLALIEGDISEIFAWATVLVAELTVINQKKIIAGLRGSLARNRKPVLAPVEPAELGPLDPLYQEYLDNKDVFHAEMQAEYQEFLKSRDNKENL